MTVTRCFRVKEVRGAASDLERALDQIPRFQDSSRVDRSDHDVDRVLLETFELSKLSDRQEFPIDKERVEALSFRPARDIGVKSFAGLHERRQDLERTTFHRRLQLFHDRGKTLFLHRQIAIRTELRSGLGEKEPEKMVNLRHRGDGGFATATCDALFDRHARRHAFHEIDVRFFQLFDELPRVGRHAVEKAALTFSK